MFGSVERRQAKELGLKLLHAPESQCGLLGKAGVQVVVGNHHHLHPRSKRRLHAVGSIFKHQTLSKDRGEEAKWYYPISLLGLQDFTPAYATKLKPKNKQQKNTGKMETGALFPSSCDGLDIPQRSAVYLCQEKYPFNLQLEERCPLWLHLIGLVYIFRQSIDDDWIIRSESLCISRGWT